MTQSATTGPLTTFAFADLAMQSALELEKARTGLPYDRQPVGSLANALKLTAEPVVSGAPFKFMEPAYFEPFERLYFVGTASPPEDVEAIQAYVRGRAKELSGLPKRGASPDSLKDLVIFCVALHRELIRDMGCEDGVSIKGWRGRAFQAPPSVR